MTPNKFEPVLPLTSIKQSRDWLLWMTRFMTVELSMKWTERPYDVEMHRIAMTILDVPDDVLLSFIEAINGNVHWPMVISEPSRPMFADAEHFCRYVREDYDFWVKQKTED